MIVLKEVRKTFHVNGKEVVAVAPTSLSVERGRAVAVMGSSGAGKSTLLRLINRLEEPSSGKVFVDDVEVTSLGQMELRQMRRRLGMVFQGFNLLSNRTVLANVAFPLEISGATGRHASARALECLEQVHLRELAGHFPAQLSGGQRQRVAIARALATRPVALLCDEPTSALDPETSDSVLSTLEEVHQGLGVTLLVVTHSLDVARRLCGSAVVMEKGVVVERLDLADPITEASTRIGRRFMAEVWNRQEREDVIDA